MHKGSYHSEESNKKMSESQKGIVFSKETLRKNLLPFTRQAFAMLPRMESPHILDIGCGSGIPTLELARIGGGQVTGIDTNQVQLDRLEKKAKDTGFSDRVMVINCSMLDLRFPEGSFDIIWAEGAIGAIGFDRGIREWRRLLKAGGYLGVHDDLKGLDEKMEQIPRCGYELVGHFIISEDTWRNEYYAPLEKKLKEILAEHANDKRIIELLSGDQREVDGFKKDKKRYRSVFFVLRKN